MIAKARKGERTPTSKRPQSNQELIHRVQARKRRRNLLFVGIIIVLIVLVGVAAAIFLAGNAPPAVGSSAHDFTLNQVTPSGLGNTITLSSKQGSVVLLEFMVSWCPNCQNDAPIVEQVYLNYTNKGVIVLAVAETWTSAEGTADLASTQHFIQQFGSTYPYVLDQNGEVANSYGVNGTPTFFVIDKSGKISAIFVGAQTQATLSRALDSALTR